MKVKLVLSTNKSSDDEKKMILDLESVEEFLGAGYGSGEYDATLQLSCMPRAVNPDELLVMIEVGASIAQNLLQCAVLAIELKKLLSKNKFLKPTITISNDKTKKSIHVDVADDDKFEILFDKALEYLDKDDEN